MNILEALNNLKRDAREILDQDEGTRDYKLIFPRQKYLENYGSHTLREKLIRVNTDRFFITIGEDKPQFKGRIYTFVPKVNISQEIYDSMLITVLHERNHALDYQNPIRRCTPEGAERFLLETVAFFNQGFYYDHYNESLLETRSFINSVLEARGFFMSKGSSREEAEERIVKALNTTASRNYALHYPRKNPNFDPFLTFFNFKDPERKWDPYSLDVSFHNFDEVFERLEELQRNSADHNYKPKRYNAPFFPLYSKDFHHLGEFLHSQGLDRKFIESLDAIDSLYFACSIYERTMNIHDELHPDKLLIFQREYFNYVKNSPCIEKDKLNLDHFIERAKEFNKERENSNTEREVDFEIPSFMDDPKISGRR